MDNFESELVHSPLSQSLTRDGHTIEVDIYANGEGGWILEVVDVYGNSTVWDEPFASDEAAWDYLQKTLDEEGIAAVVALPSAQQAPAAHAGSLSNAELAGLDSQLTRDASRSAMNVAMLDGFLTAIAIGPALVMPSQWMPWVWDRNAGEVDAPFENLVQAEAVIALLMRHYNSVIAAFDSTGGSVVPVFLRSPKWAVADWCDGFIMGFMFDEENWDWLAGEHPSWIEPFLGTAGNVGVTGAGLDGDPELWTKTAVSSLRKIDVFWKARRLPDFSEPGDWSRTEFDRQPLVRGGPKIGRNDPCPCGSGKKFKKCCSATGSSDSVH